jgi:flagellar biosynthesis protein
VLTAAGKGLVADRIIEAAHENDVPVVQDEGLAGLLSHMPVGREIPPELYRAVAEILVFISRIDEKYG